LIRFTNWQLLLNAMPQGLSEEDRERYRQAWAQPDAITGMINWYRATIRRLRTSGLPKMVQVPTLIVWGQQDPHLSYEMAPLSVELCTNGRLVTFEGATHWVQHDQPEQVSDLLIEHFSAS
jgi:pimeloyl-ACP methyl ester carboxylesterase